MSFFAANPNTKDAYQWVDVFIKAIPYAQASGMLVTALDKGHASLMLPARDTWSGDTERNRIHTGCLSVLADTACGIAVGTALDEMEPFATLDLRMDYLRSADASKNLICHAHCHRLSRSVAFVSAELRQPGCDDVVAIANATFMRATANKPRTDLAPGATPAPKAAKPTVQPPAIHVVSMEAIAAAAKSQQPAIPEGRSPYVDFLGVMQHPQVNAGPIFRLPFRHDLIGNPMLPALHGGVLAGFAETAMIMHVVATNPHLEKAIPKAIDFAIDYQRSAKPVDTYAQGITVRQGNRVSLVQVNVWQDDPSRPVASTRGHILMPQ
ncbi:MAG: PaaI family thioesterase [Burkholderiales bacterium]|nr:PaaI family thioesterase [Burkholderiales bacterium]